MAQSEAPPAFGLSQLTLDVIAQRARLAELQAELAEFRTKQNSMLVDILAPFGSTPDTTLVMLLERLFLVYPSFPLDKPLQSAIASPMAKKTHVDLFDQGLLKPHCVVLLPTLDDARAVGVRVWLSQIIPQLWLERTIETLYYDHGPVWRLLQHLLSELSDDPRSATGSTGRMHEMQARWFMYRFLDAMRALFRLINEIVEPEEPQFAVLCRRQSRRDEGLVSPAALLLHDGRDIAVVAAEPKPIPGSQKAPHSASPPLNPLLDLETELRRSRPANASHVFDVVDIPVSLPTIDPKSAEERGQRAMVAKNTLAQLSQPGGEALTGFYFDACAGTVTTIHPLFSRNASEPSAAEPSQLDLRASTYPTCDSLTTMSESVKDAFSHSIPAAKAESARMRKTTRSGARLSKAVSTNATPKKRPPLQPTVHAPFARLSPASASMSRRSSGTGTAPKPGLPHGHTGNLAIDKAPALPDFAPSQLPPFLQRAQGYLLVVGRFLPHESPSRFYSLLHAFLPFDTQVRNMASHLADVPGLEEKLAEAGLTVHPPEDAYWARELDACDDGTGSERRGRGETDGAETDREGHGIAEGKQGEGDRPGSGGARGGVGASGKEGGEEPRARQGDGMGGIASDEDNVSLLPLALRSKLTKTRALRVAFDPQLSTAGAHTLVRVLDATSTRRPFSSSPYSYPPASKGSASWPTAFASTTSSSSLPRPSLSLTLADRPIPSGRTADVCPAAIGDYPFIIKYCLERSAEDDYWGEDKIYSCIAEKAPWLAPFFVGLFTRHDPVDGSRLALVVERWGQSLKSFDLEKDERLAIFKLLEQLHAVIGVIHGAFRPDNVVVDSGSRVFKLIDFGRSTWHDCPGTTTCEELAYARFDLKLHGD